MPTRWTTECAARLPELVANGMSDSDIATLLGVAKKTVADRRCNDLNIKRPPHRNGRRKAGQKPEPLAIAPVVPGVTFKFVPEFPFYAIGDDGSAWSCHYGRWEMLSPGPQPSGHLHVNLKHEGRVKTFRLHRLVLELFVGPCPPGMEGMHTPDPDPTNCRLSNLRWGTRLENRHESKAQGRNNWGPNNANSKLSADDIPEIIRLRKAGLSLSVIARRYGVTTEPIRQIVHGRAWKNIAVPILQQG